jgi:hypothetical protein
MCYQINRITRNAQTSRPSAVSQAAVPQQASAQRAVTVPACRFWAGPSALVAVPWNYGKEGHLLTLMVLFGKKKKYFGSV